MNENNFRQRRWEDAQVSLYAMVKTTKLDKPHTQMLEQISAIYGEGFKTFHAKNLDYGDSFIRTGLEQYESLPYYGTPVQAVEHGVFTRSGDKRNRYREQAFGDGQNAADEERYETAMDAMNYWATQAWLAKHGAEMIPQLVDEEDIAEDTSVESGGETTKPTVSIRE